MRHKEQGCRPPPQGCGRSLLIAIAVVITFWGCSPKIVTVEKIQKEIEYRDRLQVDSVLIMDSVYIKDSGDTVYVYKYKYIDKFRLIRDTTFINHTDSIPYAVEVITEVNRLTKSQKDMIVGFWVLLSILILYLSLRIAAKFGKSAILASPFGGIFSVIFKVLKL